MGESELAIAAYTQLEKLSSESDVPHFGLADVYFYNLSNYDRAVEEYRSGLQWGEGDARVFLNLGASLNALGQYPNAVEILSRALVRFPENSETYRELGRAYAALGMKDEAAGANQEAARLDPTPAKVHLP